MSVQSHLKDYSVLLRSAEEECAARLVGARALAPDSSLQLDLPIPSPVLQIGRQVRLGLSGAALTSPLELDGFPVFRQEDSSSRRYEVRLPGRADVPRILLTNKRQWFRVRSSDGHALRVSIDQPSGNVLEATIQDLSGGGLGLLVEPGHEELLYRAEKLHLRIRLPAHEEPLTVTGIVRHRRLMGSSIAYGIEFDPSTPRFLETQKAIVRYVMVHQARERSRKRRLEAG